LSNFKKTDELIARASPSTSSWVIGKSFGDKHFKLKLDFAEINES
jgi:hypothetical protein